MFFFLTHQTDKHPWICLLSHQKLPEGGQDLSLITFGIPPKNGQREGATHSHDNREGRDRKG